jgi:DNA integrity scanning protein DisA with diadenylate cyclase activity
MNAVTLYKTKTRKLLGSDGRLLEGVEKTVQAMEGARSDWDDKLTAYYIVELHTLVEELLKGSGKIDELRY